MRRPRWPRPRAEWGGTASAGCRQGKGDRRALPRRALDPHVAAVRFHQRLDDSQPQAGAALISATLWSGSGTIAPVEAFEELCESPLPECPGRCRALCRNSLARALQREADLSAIRCELERALSSRLTSTWWSAVWGPRGPPRLHQVAGKGQAQSARCRAGPGGTGATARAASAPRSVDLQPQLKPSGVGGA